jgi:hypothetical protein
MDLFKACNELGVTCETKELPVPFTIIWLRQVTECKLSADNKVCLNTRTACQPCSWLTNLLFSSCCGQRELL